MSAVWEAGLPVVFVILVWWASTGVIFYLNVKPEETYPLSLTGAVIVAAASLFALCAACQRTTPFNAMVAMTAAVAIWGLIEMAFLMGYVTGPRRLPCPKTSTSIERFGFACQALAYHEAALLGALCVIAWLSAGAPNQMGVWTFGLLWLMRLSTKLNIFLGVPNVALEMLPSRIAFMQTYFGTGTMNGLFPVSVTAATIATFVLICRASDAGTDRFAFSALTMLATFSGLGLLEHWFLVTPIAAHKMWSWPAERTPRDRAGHADSRASDSNREILSVTVPPCPQPAGH